MHALINSKNHFDIEKITDKLLHKLRYTLRVNSWVKFEIMKTDLF